MSEKDKFKKKAEEIANQAFKDLSEFNVNELTVVLTVSVGEERSYCFFRGD